VTPTAYQLTNDAYVCLADNRLVFSDLKADKYRCLNETNTQAALHIFPRLGREDTNAVTAAVATDYEQAQLVMHALVDKGLLACGAASGKEVAPVSIPIPTNSLFSSKPSSLPRYHLGHLVSFLLASIKASGKLRLESLRQIVRGVENRKRRYSHSISQDCDALYELATIFHHFRPYYGREYLCRFDSLALIEFLAHYRQFPRWVFGVKSGPFSAHCWVQDGDCVLNDSIEYVCKFTPIMTF
jgi:hypothetical protein